MIEMPTPIMFWVDMLGADAPWDTRPIKVIASKVLYLSASSRDSERCIIHLVGGVRLEVASDIQGVEERLEECLR